MIRAAWTLPILLLPLLAGCLAGTPGGTVITTSGADPVRPHVVLGLVDDGINPYHEAFRDLSDEAYAHPATYLPGYPATAVALRLSLNSSYDDAMAADAPLWKTVEPGVLYWIPGTRIVAYYRAEDLPALDDAGFGTAAAGRAAGHGTSLAPEAKLAVAAATGEQDAAVEWVTNQTWVDVLLIGWNAPRTGANPDPAQPLGSSIIGPLAAFAATRPLIVAAGNGAFVPGAATVGGVGVPAFTDGTAGVPGALVVGGHDNGKVTPWTGTMPHVVADARDVAVPAHDDSTALADPSSPAASGTTVAAAWVAGAAARLLLDARLALHDLAVGSADGALARGNASASGLLADGSLDLAELRSLLLRTSDPAATSDEADGGEGDLTDRLGRATLPIAWSQAPEGAWRYAFHGYGAVTRATLDAARAVLLGDAPLPERPEADEWAARDEEIRRALSS